MARRLARLAVLVAWFLGPTATAREAGPSGVADDVIVQYGLSYRDGSPSCKLDLAMPRQPAAAPRPAILVIHGGGWIEGSRASFSRPEERRPGHIIDLARLGFVAASIDYRLSKEAPFPAAVQDCKCAVRWLRANAAKYQVDPERIGAWGGSAGGHLGLMLALTDRSAALEGDGPHQELSSAIQAAFSDSGPIDLTHQYHHRQVHQAVLAFMGGPPEGPRTEDYRRASPISYVTGKAPPLMLTYGAVDTQVGVETADRFVEALGRGGAKDVSYYRLGTADHCPFSMVRVPWLVPAANEFFRRTLRLPPAPPQR